MTRHSPIQRNHDTREAFIRTQISQISQFPYYCWSQFQRLHLWNKGILKSWLLLPGVLGRGRGTGGTGRTGAVIRVKIWVETRCMRVSFDFDEFPPLFRKLRFKSLKCPPPKCIRVFVIFFVFFLLFSTCIEVFPQNRTRIKNFVWKIKKQSLENICTGKVLKNGWLLLLILKLVNIQIIINMLVWM